ncbi:integrase, catalytic region, zinc finger, CCHC-type containing protein [Tanacetum coccineum]
MCKRQGYMIRDMERKCVTTDELWKVHGKVDQVLHDIVPQLAEKATNDLIEGNLKRVVADTIIQERDAFQAEVPDLISKEFDAQAPQIIEELFKTYVQNNVIQVHPITSTSTETNSSINLQQQLYLKMKSNLQDQGNDPVLWDVLKYSEGRTPLHWAVDRDHVKAAKLLLIRNANVNLKVTVT